jgi:hypothetical protein
VASRRIVEKRTLPDGLMALREELTLTEIMRLIERTARWVAPETFWLLPIWFPEYARRVYFYKANWSEPQMNKNRQTGISEHKREVNTYANKTLTLALGLRPDDRQNWSYCHVWGVDDALYQKSNAIVQNRHFYSCVANLVLLPTPLKAFTDTMSEVKAMIRICARNLYGWHCPHESMAEAIAGIDVWGDWSAYPASWPRKPGDAPPPGVMPLNDGIRFDAKARLTRVRQDLELAGPHYPKDEVRKALAYWRIEV